MWDTATPNDPLAAPTSDDYNDWPTVWQPSEQQIRPYRLTLNDMDD